MPTEGNEHVVIQMCLKKLWRCVGGEQKQMFGLSTELLTEGKFVTVKRSVYGGQFTFNLLFDKPNMLLYSQTPACTHLP